MSRVVDGITIICVEPDSKCELCGVITECRPYGPKGESICFDCAQLDKEGTERRMRTILFGEGELQV